jgi:hypothetical protein
MRTQIFILRIALTVALGMGLSVPVMPTVPAVAGCSTCR